MVWSSIGVKYLVRYGENLLVGIFVEAELGDVVSDYYWELGVAFTNVVNEGLPQLGRFPRHK